MEIGTKVGAYELTCGNLPAITGLNFVFFQRFPNAQTVHVDLVTGKGAFSFDVPRANPAVLVPQAHHIVSVCGGRNG